jgi:hypothetical protein
VYEAAPEGTIATELPEQIVALFTVTVGVVFTEIVDTALAEIQPLVDPFTVYAVVLLGVTV